LGEAWIGALAVVLAAAIPSWLVARRAKARTTDIAEAVGTPNGNGTLVQMAERLLGMQAESLGWQQRHDAHDDERFQVINARLDKLESTEGTP
jgi:hypothetical protein